MASTLTLAAQMLRCFDNSNLQHQPGVAPEERRLAAMEAALDSLTERDFNGVRFRLGDMVETTKGAKFWGEIIAFDTDEASPGCTVRAVDPGFEGTKHVYPLKQLGHAPARAATTIAGGHLPRPEDEWHEDYGNVVWWTLTEDGQWLGEPAYIGTPLDLGRAILVTIDGKKMTCEVGGWPGYHTHWTPHPAFPPLPAKSGSDDR